MNNVRRGESLEAIVADLLDVEISEGRLPFRADSCRLFRKKGYYSRDRKSKIVFDVSIEVFFPDAKSYSLLLLVECKNYTHSVPVDDVEEFFQKVQQVAAANAKAIVVSTASFQSGAFAFAESKGIGLARYFDSNRLKWDLYRSPSMDPVLSARDGQDIREAMQADEYASEAFDWYMVSAGRSTHSPHQFFLGLADSVLTRSQLRRISPPRCPQAEIPFLSNPELEQVASLTRASVGYTGGAVSLRAICDAEYERCGLVVEHSSEPPNSRTLGRITFSPVVRIQLFVRLPQNDARLRFTLAHELSHHLLGHSRYLRREHCEESDFKGERQERRRPEIQRMEFQANHLAAALLMPKVEFCSEFLWVSESYDIRRRGNAVMYVDQQRCNLDTYHGVTEHLGKVFQVSKAAAALRLAGLGLLRDDRTATTRHAVSWLADGLDDALTTAVTDGLPV